MANATEITTHVAEAVARLLQQDKDKERISGLAESIVSELQNIETATFDLIQNRLISNSTGVTLDRIGDIVGVERLLGESDTDYRGRILRGIFRNRAQGTPESIIEAALFFAAGATILLIEGSEASFAIEVLNVTLTQNQIDDLYAIIRAVKPAGVNLEYIGLAGFDSQNFFAMEGPTVDNAAGFGTIYETAFSLVSSSDDANQWFDVCWSVFLNKYFAVGVTGTNRVMSSPDGLVWTGIASANESAQWNGIISVEELGLLVACSNAFARIMTSPDGTTWTQRTTPSGNAYRDLVWGPEKGLIVCVCSTATIVSAIMTSPDGINWTNRATPNLAQLRGVTYSKKRGRYVAVSDSAASPEFNVLYSDDGITWKNPLSGQVPVGATGWTSVTYSEELDLFVAVANAGTNRVMVSNDGESWTFGTISANGWDKVMWIPNLHRFVASASSGTGRAQTSRDGLTWTNEFTSFDSGFAWEGITYSPTVGRLVLVGSGGADRVMVLYKPTIGGVWAELAVES